MNVKLISNSTILDDLRKVQRELRDRLNLCEMNFPPSQTTGFIEGGVWYNNVKASIINIDGRPVFDGKFVIFDKKGNIRFDGNFNRGRFDGPVIEYSCQKGKYVEIKRIEIIGNEIIEKDTTY